MTYQKVFWCFLFIDKIRIKYLSRKKKLNSKGQLFTQDLTQTAVLPKQWAQGILSKKVDLIQQMFFHYKHVTLLTLITKTVRTYIKLVSLHNLGWWIITIVMSLIVFIPFISLLKSREEI